MIKPEQITTSFYQVIREQPELFQGEAFQDLPYLEIALDSAEQSSDEEKIEVVADAIIDFCDSNPAVDQAVRQELEQHLDETVSEEMLSALTQTVDSLLEKQERAQVESINNRFPELGS